MNHKIYIFEKRYLVNSQVRGTEKNKKLKLEGVKNGINYTKRNIKTNYRGHG